MSTSRVVRRPSVRNQILLACMATLLAVIAAGAPAGAQSYPDKRITPVEPIPAGGLVDALARSLGEWLNDSWGGTVVVS